MVEFGAVYALDGTVIPGAGLRRQLQDSAGEGSGVVRAGDLKVTQMDVPGAGVKIASGSVLVQSRAPGVRELETYGVPLYEAQNYLGDDGAGIPGTGSSVPSGGRRDMLFVEILDPDLPTWYTPQANWAEGASTKLSIVQNVPATARTMDDVPALANVTGYAVAKITYPASTTTVTNAMIEDLRNVQSPKSVRVWRPVNLSELQRLSSTAAYPTGGQTWPTEFTGEAGKLSIPKWATHARIRMDWGSVRFLAAAAGLMWVQVGQNVHPDVKRTQMMSFDAAASSRESLFVVDTIAIPASMRGTDQWFYPRANLSAAIATESQRPYVNTSSGLVLDVEFFQNAV